MSNKRNTTKLTLKDLIAKKEQILEAKKTPQRAELYIESLDGCITVLEPSKALIRDAQEMDDADEYLLYNSVIEPNLKSGELREAYGAATGVELVDMFFKPGEVTQIARECLRLAGVGDTVEVVGDLKN